MKEFILPHRHGKGDIEKIQSELLQVNRFSSVAEIFKQLSDTTRMRIFWLLCHQEQCVINIAAFLNMSSPAVSHHLRSLQECGLISCRRDGKEVYYKAADNEECNLLHKTAEHIMEITCPEKTDSSAKSAEEIIYSIHEYLVEHLSERVTIEELSRRFLMNPTTLKSTFRKVYGMSLAAHVKEHRMERAAKLLKNSEQTVAQIATAVGYESQSRFSAAFKESYGMLPTEFRKK